MSWYLVHLVRIRKQLWCINIVTLGAWDVWAAQHPQHSFQGTTKRRHDATCLPLGYTLGITLNILGAILNRLFSGHSERQVMVSIATVTALAFLLGRGYWGVLGNSRGCSWLNMRCLDIRLVFAVWFPHRRLKNSVTFCLVWLLKWGYLIGRAFTRQLPRLLIFRRFWLCFLWGTPAGQVTELFTSLTKGFQVQTIECNVAYLPTESCLRLSKSICSICQSTSACGTSLMCFPFNTFKFASLNSKKKT